MQRFLIFILFLIAFVPGRVTSADSHAAIAKLIQDYTGLYRRESLAQWKQLFHPSAVIMFPADDGTVNVRNVEEFFARQQNFFAQKKSVSERLENLQIREGRKIARVSADFVFVSDGVEKRGKLGLHLVEGKEGWRIASLIFSYDQP
jgi:Putative lumazine-binding